MKTAFVVIATSSVYVGYARTLIMSMHEHLQFEFRPLIFTDDVQKLNDVGACFKIDALGYPGQTLYRYHTMLTEVDYLSKYDQIFYVDADMLFVKDVQLDQIASEGLTATLHPGYFVNNTLGDTERRLQSTAYCTTNTKYYCGGFQGGDSFTYLAAARRLSKRIDADAKNNITAKWHDESHWNRFLADAPPTRVLTPSFCYPENYNGGYGWQAAQYPPYLVAVHKKKHPDHPRFK